MTESRPVPHGACYRSAWLQRACGLAMSMVACAPCATAVAQTPAARKHTETLLAPFPAAVWDSAMVSPNVRRIAYVKQTATGRQVVVDGREEKPYEKVAGLTFSPDSRQTAYAATVGGKWFVVLGGVEGPPYEQVGLPTFSPDGRHLAYVALLADGQRVIVLDGKPGPPCEMVFEGLIALSPDGRRMAYGARRADGWFVATSEIPPAPASPPAAESGPYEFLGSSTGIQFSRDGTRLAYAAQVNKKWCVVLDGKPQPAFDNLGPLVFSPDGRRVAYAAMQRDGQRETWRVVADETAEGQSAGPLDAIGEGTLQFSPDGRHLAYAAQTGKAWCIVLDGKPGEPFDGIAQVKFSPNSQTLAYVVKRGRAEAVINAPLDPVGPAVPHAEPVGPAVPAAKPVAAKPVGPPARGDLAPAAPAAPPRFFDRIGGGTLVFSPSGRHLAYVARSGPWSFVVVDGNRKPRYDMVGYLTFTPDGRWPVYAAVKGKKTFTVVDDREPAQGYDTIWLPRGEALRFFAPTRFRYLAVKDGAIYAVEEQLD